MPAFTSDWAGMRSIDGSTTASDSVSRVGRAWRWLWAPGGKPKEQWGGGADHCPLCGQELPSFRPGNQAMTGGAGLGPAWLPPTREELTAKCPWDGHPPYNDKARAMLRSGALRDTRTNGR